MRVDLSAKIPGQLAGGQSQQSRPSPFQAAAEAANSGINVLRIQYLTVWRNAGGVSTTDSYVAGVAVQVPCRASLWLRPGPTLFSSCLSQTDSLARTPDGHGTRDVGPSPQSKKAETLPAAGLESGH